MAPDELKRLLVPPAHPSCVASRASWAAVQASGGIAYPDDYRAFVDAYGAGHVDGYLGVSNPFIGDSSGLNGERLIEEERQRHHELVRSLGRDVVPYPMFPSPGGLYPWGRDTNGGVFYWVTGNADPNRWPVFEYQDGAWSQFDGGMCAFLIASLSGRYQSPALGTDFPSTTPAYYDPWWEPCSLYVELSGVTLALAKQLEVAQLVFGAVPRHRDPSSDQGYAAVSMVVPPHGWRMTYRARRQPSGNPDFLVSVTLELRKTDVPTAKGPLSQLARALGATGLRASERDGTGGENRP